MGFADRDNSLDWLFEAGPSVGKEGRFAGSFAGVGAMAMGDPLPRLQQPSPGEAAWKHDHQAAAIGPQPGIKPRYRGGRHRPRPGAAGIHAMEGAWIPTAFADGSARGETQIHAPSDKRGASSGRAWVSR